MIAPAVTIADGIAPTWRVRARPIAGTIRLLAIGVLALALGGAWNSRVAGDRRALDIVMLIDVSQSMRAGDVPPDRLRAATAFGRRLVELRPHDRFGIVLFAGDDAIACPLTADHGAVVSRLEAIEPGAGSGTALGSALLGALERLPEPRHGGVVLVISDGSSNRGDVSPVDAAARLRTAGVRVMTAAVGQEGPAPFPTESGIVRAPAAADEALLRAVGDAGAGTFVRADADGGAVMLARALDAVPGTQTTGRSAFASPPWIGVAVASLLAIELAFATVVLRCWV